MERSVVDVAFKFFGLSSFVAAYVGQDNIVQRMMSSRIFVFDIWLPPFLVKKQRYTPTRRMYSSRGISFMLSEVKI